MSVAQTVTVIMHKSLCPQC